MLCVVANPRHFSLVETVVYVLAITRKYDILQGGCPAEIGNRQLVDVTV